MFRTVATFLILAISSSLAQAAITDLTTWSQVADPPHAGMTSTNVGPNSVTLVATGAVPSGTDRGFQSVDGVDVATSGEGYYFSPLSDFQVAIDFSVSSSGSLGAGGIGFGVGEDGLGVDSAGGALGFVNGSPLAFATAGRVNDVNQPLQVLSTTAFSSGRFFVGYDSTTADIIFGVNSTPGALVPTETKTLAGIQAQWNDEPLLVSFFLRSQAVSIFSGFSSGQIDATFSNFQVLSGTPLAAIPEPSAILLISLASGQFLLRRHARG